MTQLDVEMATIAKALVDATLELDALKRERDALKSERAALNEAINAVSGWIERENPELYNTFINIIFPVLSQNRNYENMR